MPNSTTACWKKPWSDTPLISLKDRRATWASHWPMFALLLIVLASGCKKPEEDLGLDILPGDPLGTRVETTPVHAFTFEPEAIRTSGLTRNVLGSYLDPVFGSVQAGIVAQLRLSSNNVGAGQDNTGLVADSMVLALGFDGINFAYGNLNAQSFQVHELSEALSIDSTFTTDLVPEFLPEDLVADRGRRITPRPFTKPFIGGDSLQPQVRIRLDKMLAQRILDAFGTPALVDNAAFLEFFKGVYITADNGAQIPFQQGILYFNLLSATSKATVYYRNTLEPEPTPRFFDLAINQTSVRYSVVAHDHAQAIDAGLGLALADSTLPAQQVYVQALGGLRAGLRFPELRSYAGQGLVVAKAELVVPVPGTFNPYLSPPAQLFIFRQDTVTGTDIFLPDQVAGSGNIDGNYRPNAKEYRFNITRYIQGVITGTIPDTGVELVPGSNGITANRVVLAGPAHPEEPMRLDLTFTTY
ncbi:MAG: DUF4270 family protein [Flavobacteriales bacterium]